MGNQCSSKAMHKLIVASVLFTYFLPHVLMQSFFKEGQDAFVEYSFPDINPSSVAVEIRKGSTIIFERTRKENLNAQQANRIRISKEARDEDTLVRLSIINITREDESVYFCVLYDSQGAMVLDSQEKLIVVEFPPGPANCSSIESSEASIQDYLGSDDTWTVIKCHATRGTQFGYIACFSPDLRLPPLNMHSNRTHLIGMFWAKKNKPVFCCSATFRNDVDRCTCTEYKSHKEQALCSFTPNEEELITSAYQPDMATPSKPFVSNSRPTDATPLQGQQCHNILCTIKIVGITLICEALIILLLLALKCYVSNTVKEVEKKAKSNENLEEVLERVMSKDYNDKLHDHMLTMP
ncbi:uncharacterized protein [Diadema antillarum]|uniref:uncharacterized protein n=1 Tax=Diadema antillarum TaxID=105358 RepID=UPI003A86DE1E